MKLLGLNDIRQFNAIQFSLILRLELGYTAHYSTVKETESDRTQEQHSYNLQHRASDSNAPRSDHRDRSFPWPSLDIEQAFFLTA